jgi:superfamily II DNA or RNA helicase
MTNKTAIIKILDEVNCVIIGLDDADNIFLKKKYSPLAEGYFFSKKYKLGIWDGTISFYSKGGKTFNNLIPEIYKFLKDRQYKIELIDNRLSHKLTVPYIDKDYFKDTNITLGDHQVDAVNKILDNNGGIILAATGSGKTFICSALAKSYNDTYGYKVIIIVPSSDLVLQGVEDLQNLNIDVGQYDGDKIDLDHPIIISTWQKIQNNPHMVGAYNIIIVDEAHGTRGAVLKDILNNYGAHALVRIGVTGTLPESEVDKLSVKITLGDPVYIITAKQLIDSGWLAELDIDILELTEDKKPEFAQWKIEFPDEAEGVTYAKFLETLFPDYDSEKKYLNSNESRLSYISNIVEINRSKNKGNSLILVNSIAAGKKLQTMLPESHFVHGMDKKAFRRAVYQLFKDNDDVVVIATSQLASTGLNIPRIFYLYLIDIGKSYIRVIQSIGRGLRKAHDKNHVFVFDISSNLKYSKQHQAKRIVHYKKAEYPHKKIKIDYKKTH